MEMNKVVFVKAHFKRDAREEEVFVPTEEKVGGIFGVGAVSKQEKCVVKKDSDCEVDGDRLSHDIAEAITQLNQEGYKVVSVIPITSGRYDYNYKEQEIKSKDNSFSQVRHISGGVSYGYGYGYSYSEGVTIIGERVTVK